MSIGFRQSGQSDKGSEMKEHARTLHKKANTVTLLVEQ